jgi:hypothetical protein
MKTSIGQRLLTGNDEEPCITARRTTFSAVAGIGGFIEVIGSLSGERVLIRGLWVRVQRTL